MNSEQLFEKSKTLVPGGVHSPVRSFKGLHTTPRFINRTQGAFIYDEEGKDYIDFCMSFGPLIHGHRDPEVEEEVKRALSRGWSFGACEKYSLELAEFIVNKIEAVDQIRFMNSGTEAVMTAVRLARGYTGKNKIIKFNGCYHGHLDSMLIKAGSGLAGTAQASSKGITHHVAEDTLVCDLGDIEALEEVFKNHKDIAGVFIEPLPANSGLMPQDLEYLKKVHQLCISNNTLLVFDEVISGFRVAFGGMSEKTGIIPDIVTYGKIIGGGFPVGAVGGKKEIMEYLAPVGDVYQAGTLSANPVAMVAGLVNCKKLNDSFYQQLEQNTAAIVNVFKEWFDKNGFDDYGFVQEASLFWYAPTHEKVSGPNQIPHNLMERFVSLFEILLNKGIYLSPNAYEIGFGSAAHTSDIIAILKERLWS